MFATVRNAPLILSIVILSLLVTTHAQAKKRVFKGNEAVAEITIPLDQPDPGLPQKVGYIVNYSDLLTWLALRPESYPPDPSSAELKAALNDLVERKLLHHAAGSFLHVARIRFSKFDLQQRIDEYAKAFASKEAFDERVAIINALEPVNSARLPGYALEELQNETYLRISGVDRQKKLDEIRGLSKIVLRQL